MKTHLRPPGGGRSYCGAIGYTTASPAGTDCKRCRKAVGLGAYNALDALAGILRIDPSPTLSHAPK